MRSPCCRLPAWPKRRRPRPAPSSRAPLRHCRSRPRQRLNADIDLAQAPGLFLPYLAGTLDGNGHRISKLNVSAPGQPYLGLVGMNAGTVRNLGVVDAVVDGLHDVGALVGRNRSGARIETSFSSGSVRSLFSGAGGLAGANHGAIRDSHSSASVDNESGAKGGLAGIHTGTIDNSLASGAVGSGGGGLIRTSEPEDSVLVFYAGHGYIHPGSSVGYWLPSGANIDDPRGWLSNVDIARFLANMPARQLLLVSDSCFSGGLTREGVAAEQRAGMSRNAILMRRSVVALSSGGEEVVVDSTHDGHSPFTYDLLRELEAAKGEIPAHDMLLAIRDKVSKSSQGQVPAYGIIMSSGHASGGEYLLNPTTN